MSENNTDTVLEKKKALNLEDMVLVKEYIDDKINTEIGSIDTKIDNKLAEVKNETVPMLDELNQDLQLAAIHIYPKYRDDTRYESGWVI